MELARVIGTVVATHKVPGLDGVKMLLVEPLDANLEVAGESFVACDSSQAGVGDIVHWIGGREAALAMPVHFVPVDAAIVGIVDEVSVGGKPIGGTR